MRCPQKNGIDYYCPFIISYLECGASLADAGYAASKKASSSFFLRALT
jgi:hypothetical protein